MDVERYIKMPNASSTPYPLQYFIYIYIYICIYIYIYTQLTYFYSWTIAHTVRKYCRLPNKHPRREKSDAHQYICQHLCFDCRTGLRSPYPSPPPSPPFPTQKTKRTTFKIHKFTAIYGPRS